jgi:hypothetical protein
MIPRVVTASSRNHFSSKVGWVTAASSGGDRLGGEATLRDSGAVVEVDRLPGGVSL